MLGLFKFSLKNILFFFSLDQSISEVVVSFLFFKRSGGSVAEYVA